MDSTYRAHTTSRRAPGAAHTVSVTRPTQRQLHTPHWCTRHMELPGAMRAVSATISTWCASRAPILGLVGPFKYQHDLSHLARLVGEQRVLHSRVRLPIGDK